MATPVTQGTLNRLRATISFTDHPELNITPSFLGRDMVTVAPQGDVTHIIPTATGLVTSPEPYQIVEISAHILRTNGLGDRYKKQLENLSTIGNCTVRFDVVGFSDMPLTNASIKSVDAIKADGTEAGWVIHIQAAYIINQALYSL